MARTLLEESTLVFQGHFAMMAPLYPMFLAGSYALPGPDRLAVLLIQILLGAAMTAAVYLIGRKLFSERAALAAAIFCALYYPLITISMSVLSEALFIPLMTLSLLFALYALFDGGKKNFAMAGILAGLACLTRPVIIYLPLLLAIAAALGILRRRLNMRWLHLAIFLGCFYLTLSPWAYRNWQVLGKPILTSTNTGMVMATSAMPRYGKFFGFDLRASRVEPERRYIFDLPELEQNRELKKLAMDYYRQHPETIPRLLWLKVMYLVSPFDWEVLGDNNGVFNPWFVWVTVLSITGLLTASWNTGRVMLAFVPFYFISISLATYASSRLRLPLIPALIVFAGAGWVHLEKRTRTGVLYPVAAIILVLSAAGFLFSSEFKLLCSRLARLLGIW